MVKRMKKIICILLVLLGSLWCLCACGEAKEDGENRYQVYYINNSETKIEPYEYEIPPATAGERVDKLLEYLATPPEKMPCKAPLSLGFGLNSVKVEEEKVLLDVDSGYLNLSTTTEVLLRAAIVKTLTQLPEIGYVCITVEGNQLFDSMGDIIGFMSGELFISNDGNEINTYELTKIKLYFANEDGDKLVGTYREKHYSTNTPLDRFVVEELIAGPSGQLDGICPTINPDTKIISVMTKDGICYVNLDSNFLTVVNNVATEVAVYSLVNSLVELNNINKVQILIDGEVPESLGTNNVFERNLDYVTSLN